ncbi:hypothetical protein V8E54_007528 [Elaphomyces granulatus]
MRFLGFTCLSLAILLGVSSAGEQMQINYYSNSVCSEYKGQLDVTWASPFDTDQSNCYTFNYGTSVNIANCYESYCQCRFYSQSDCHGTEGTVVYGSAGNCLSESYNYNSFACYYISS